MTVLAGLLDHNAPLTEARRRLAEPRRGEPAFRMVCAAALLAASACCLAMAVILGPFWRINNPQLTSVSPHLASTSAIKPQSPVQSATIVAAPPPPMTLAKRHIQR